MPHRDAGEIMIGDYQDGGGVSADGEFQIVLHDLGGEHPRLSPQLRAFGDATGALHRAIDTGLLDALGNVADADELSRRLIGLGMVDTSHNPLPDISDDIHTTIDDAAAANGTATRSATLRGFIYAALHDDAIADAVNDLLFDHVGGGRHHPSVVAQSLRPLIDEVLDSATAADWQHVADQLIEEARQATATDSPRASEEGA